MSRCTRTWDTGISDTFQMLAVIETLLLDLRDREMRRAPSCSPALLDRGQAKQRDDRQDGEHQEAGLVARGQLPGVAEAGRQVEPADATRHADHPGHHA